MCWELRRLLRNRFIWLLLPIVFILSWAVMWRWGIPEIAIARYFPPYGPTLTASGTSVWGISQRLPNILLLPFGFFIPFIAVTLLTHDLLERTHELLMASQVPSWAFVWGRYLAALAVSLSLATAMLLGVLLLVQQQGSRAFLINSPPPNIGAMLAVWAVMVLPSVVLMCGLAVALAALLPGRGKVAGIMLLLAWLLNATLVPALVKEVPRGGLSDPGSLIMANAISTQYRQRLFAETRSADIKTLAQVKELQKKEYLLEQEMPDLSAWLPGQAFYVSLGFGAVALAAWRFRRFQDPASPFGAIQRRLSSLTSTSTQTRLGQATSPTTATTAGTTRPAVLSKAPQMSHKSFRQVFKPLVVIFRGQLWRLAGQASYWSLVAFSFALFVGLSMYQQHGYIWGIEASGADYAFHITGTSAWGIVHALPEFQLRGLGMIIPFVCADLVSRDRWERTRELLLATGLPGWAYMLGRYLAGLVASLGLAVVMLLGIVFTGGAYNLLLDDPPPNLAAVLALWTVMVVPAVVLLSGLSIAIGTLFPRVVTFVQVAIAASWAACSYYLNPGFLGINEEQPLLKMWEPTGIVMSNRLEVPYFEAVEHFPRLWQEIEQRMPDLWPWLGSRATWAIFGVLLVVAVGLVFRRLPHLR
jgi:ABC-type transport system involved in multi-copper enzyme maturation permease subunit